ncbi:MAG: hypothetical protein M3Y45_06680, partial [Actinomycetota bacterium]|nr:hypothetical protein [Actinomycetota bacterium]
MPTPNRPRDTSRIHSFRKSRLPVVGAAGLVLLTILLAGGPGIRAESTVRINPAPTTALASSATPARAGTKEKPVFRGSVSRIGRDLRRRMTGVSW